MFRFEQLDIWKLSIDYGRKVYKIANNFPKYEKYALSDNLRRAAVSISNNIAEGSGCGSSKGFISFLNISIRSTLEVVNILMFAESQGYISKDKREDLYQEAEVLIRKIRAFKTTLSK